MPGKAPLDHLRSRKQPRTKPVWIPDTSEVADRLVEAQERLDQARQLAQLRPDDVGVRAALQDAEDVYESAEEHARENSSKFIVRSLSPEAFDELQSGHVATKEQQEEARRNGVQGRLSFNPDTFPPALITACVHYVYDYDEEGHDLTEPLTEEFVKEMYSSGKWNEAEVTELFTTAFEVNSSRRVVDLGNGSRRTRRS